MFAYLLAAILLISLSGFYLGKNQASNLRSQTKLHSLPQYHGYFIALWCGIPTILLILLWTALEPVLLGSLIRNHLESQSGGLTPTDYVIMTEEVRNLAAGVALGTQDPLILETAEWMHSIQQSSQWSMVVVTILLAMLIMAFTRSRIAPGFKARHSVELLFNGFLFISSTIAILTTIGIVLSLIFETFRFFELVPITEFLFGLKWYPQIAIRADQVAGEGAWGAIPVFSGTLLISFVAMLVAGPIGLMSAIYFSEYASPKMRGWTKPILEILAGIPTVVYGFFAALTLAPLVRDGGIAIGLDVEARSALAAGLVMGVMIIPFISSLSDDVINAVPQTLRDGSYAMGATKSETIRQVIIPAALPGIVGAFLLAISRAIGETMIVAMAAGLNANLTANPLENVTTVTVQIVVALIGDQEFDDPKTLSAFALGLVLFVVTLILNVVALAIVKKYREKYD
ncbi:MAG: phosphate ABC transporter permease subunit PstC [Deltaproteobacteria bacterium]|jgi:phosphate transport system permease protein